MHMDDHADKKTSYRDAGVDIEKGGELIRRLKETIDNTHRKGVIGGLGGFGGLFDLGSLKYKQIKRGLSDIGNFNHSIT